MSKVDALEKLEAAWLLMHFTYCGQECQCLKTLDQIKEALNV